MDFKKFNSMIDVSGLKADIVSASENHYEEIPLGTYEVKVEKMELTESKKGDPMFSCWFKIVGNEHKDQMLFMNQVITKGFQIHIVNELLRNFDTGIDIKFEDFEQYGNMIFDIKEKIDADGLSYALVYGEHKGFKTFTITEVFEDTINF